MSSPGKLTAADRPKSLSDVAYDAIRKAIVEKTFPPGHRLTEAELARQLNVSKTPVREALLRLRHIGLIEPDGGRVITPSERMLAEAFEARGLLEAFTPRAASERASSEWREEIEAAAKASVERAAAGDVDGFRHWDRIFHLAIAEAAGNPQVERMLDDTLALVSVIVERDTDTQTSLDGGHHHVRVAEAIATRDAETAVREMREHLNYTLTYFLESFARLRAGG